MSKKSALTRTLLIIVLSAAQFTVYAQNTGTKYALLIGGSGWSEEYSVKYRKFLLETRKALIEKYFFPESQVVILAETHSGEEQFIDGSSRAENIRAQFAELSKKVSPDDHVYVILYGHGSFDGKNGKFNIPGRDLTDYDFAELLNMLHENRVIFVNTTQASFPFVPVLSTKNRVIITATKSGTQKTETHFPEYFVEALNSPSSDLDKNGDLSVLEVFTYASERTSQWFEERNHIETEHPQLEDTGDTRSFRLNELEKNAEGGLAAATFLKRRSDVFSATMPAEQDSMVLVLLQQQEQFELEIAALKRKKNEMFEQEYYDRLESLLIRLAAISDELDEMKK